MAVGRGEMSRRLFGVGLRTVQSAVAASTATIGAMLAAGFIYSAVATWRNVHLLLQQAPSTGQSASIDAYLAPVNLSSGDELRRAARCLWPANKDIVLIGGRPSFSAHDATQIYYATSYLLYPRRIVLNQQLAPAIILNVEDLARVVERR
jgi:hypothetical protein